MAARIPRSQSRPLQTASGQEEMFPPFSSRKGVQDPAGLKVQKGLCRQIPSQPSESSAVRPPYFRPPLTSHRPLLLLGK